MLRSLAVDESSGYSSMMQFLVSSSASARQDPIDCHGEIADPVYIMLGFGEGLLGTPLLFTPMRKFESIWALRFILQMPLNPSMSAWLALIGLSHLCEYES